MSQVLNYIKLLREALHKYTALSQGFTLIELLLVFSILSIISTAGIVSYSSYNTKQQLNNGAQDLVVILHTAKAKAQSQVASSACISLKSYQVVRCGGVPSCITSGAAVNDYELQSVCSNGTYVVDSKTLPPNVVFDTVASTLQSIRFDVFSGGVTTGVIRIKNGSEGRTLTITQYGKITLTNN